MKDYEELEGTSITCISWDRIYHGVILLCDPDMAVVVIDYKTKEHIFCSLGPSAPAYSGNYPEADHQIFRFLVDNLKGGYINICSVDNFLRALIGTGKPEASQREFNDLCPLGQ